MSKTYYHHTKPEKGKNRITYAGIVENSQLKIGFAKCSLKDQFIKSKGRIIAEGRARKKNCSYTESILQTDIIGKRFMEIIKNNLITIE